MPDQFPRTTTISHWLEEQGIIGAIDCIHNAKGLEVTACYDHDQVIRKVENSLLE
jgi:hypothetical protein